MNKPVAPVAQWTRNPWDFAGAGAGPGGSPQAEATVSFEARNGRRIVTEEQIIRGALEEARAKGRDYLTQIQVAVEAVRQARPDMTASDALAAVHMVRRRRPQTAAERELSLFDAVRGRTDWQ